ncbi:MAG TPA: carbohydrate kinase family protein [Gaiellaceae bacterium]|jgi:sugar/nucleoside kinase (ribokinase family)
MADVVVAGHICLDVIVTPDSPAPIEPGVLLGAGAAELSAGGAVANTGLALHHLGVDVRLCARVGDDLFGDATRAAVGELAVGLVTSEHDAGSYSIVVNRPGLDRSFLHFPGANDSFTADDVPDSALEGARLFHFGYPPLMRRMYETGGVELEALLIRVRGRGLMTSLDLAQPVVREADWAQMLRRALPYVDVFLPSLGELQLMLGVDEAPPELTKRVLDMGVRIAGVKLGDQGLYVRTADEEVVSPCFVPREVAGTTGSGDATIAGFLAALLRGDDLESAATAANAVGACSVERRSGSDGIPSWPEIEARISAGWARRT